MNTLWQEEEFVKIYSRESLAKKAAEIEKTISVKESQHNWERHILDPTMFDEIIFGIGGQIYQNHQK